jgi:uracil-DNA glycosylase
MYDHKIHSSWTHFFVLNKNLILGIMDVVDSIEKLVPNKEDIFRVFQMNLQDIKLVLLGMDPYPNPKNAMGLAFSVYKDQPIPGSLYNIYKELQQEFPERNYKFTHGDISRWMEEGIFLYNCALTTLPWKSGSHLELWKPFTNQLISYLSLAGLCPRNRGRASTNPNIVFLLLGNSAIQKKVYIQHKQNIVSATHPSPLSAHNGFFGSNVFKKLEAILQSPVNWNI